MLRGSLGSLEWGVGPGVEDAATIEAAIIRNPCAGLTPVDVKMVAPSAPRATQSLRVKQLAERLVAGVLVPRIDNEEFHVSSDSLAKRALPLLGESKFALKKGQESEK